MKTLHFIWHFFPLASIPRVEIPSVSSTIIVGINPWSNFPITESSSHENIYYLNPERFQLHNLPQQIHKIDIIPQRSIFPHEEVCSHKDPSPHKEIGHLNIQGYELPLTDRYNLWKKWYRTMDAGYHPTCAEFSSMEKQIADNIHLIIQRDRYRPQKSIVCLTFFWLFPNSMWSYLSEYDKTHVKILAPMIDSHTRFLYGDETYIPDRELRNGFI